MCVSVAYLAEIVVGEGQKALAQIVANSVVVFLACPAACCLSLSLSLSIFSLPSRTLLSCAVAFSNFPLPPACLPALPCAATDVFFLRHFRCDDAACPGLSWHVLLRMSWHFYATDKRQRRYSCLYMSYFPATISLSPLALSFCVQLLNYIQANAIYYTLRCVPDSTQLEQAPPQHLFRFKLIKLPSTMAQIDLNVVTLCLRKYGNMTSMSWMSNGNRWHSIYVEWDVL